MLKRHTHFRKIQKHYFHPKKVHSHHSLDSTFAGGGFGGLSFYPNSFGTSEHELQDYPNLLQGVPLFPSESLSSAPQMAALSNGNYLMDSSTGVHKPLLKYSNLFSKLQGNRFNDFNEPQFGRVNVNDNGNLGTADHHFDEIMHKFPIEYEEESDGEDLEENYGDDFEIKPMQDQENLYSYNPETIDTSMNSNIKGKWPPAYSQQVGNTGLNAAFKWSTTDDNDNYPRTPEWMTSEQQQSIPITSDEYTINQQYSSPTLTNIVPQKRKKLRTSGFTANKLKLPPTAGSSVATGYDQSSLNEDRWNAKKKKVKSEKIRRRRPARGASGPYYRITHTM